MLYDGCMSAPDYLICLECETPTYLFEWDAGRIKEAQCLMCGNDDTSQFASEEELEDMVAPAGFGPAAAE